MAVDDEDGADVDADGFFCENPLAALLITSWPTKVLNIGEDVPEARSCSFC